LSVDETLNIVVPMAGRGSRFAQHDRHPDLYAGQHSGRWHAETTAGRLHAPILGLICTDDRPQVMEPAEKADVQS
jgi:hypothetical protein